MRRFSRQGWLGLLGLVISAAAIYLLLSQIDLSQFGDVLKTARYGFFLPAIGLLLLGLIVRAARWRFLLNHPMRNRDSLSILGITYLLNSLLPLRAGELARLYLASRLSPPVSALTAAATVVLERMLDAVIILLCITVTIAVGGPLPTEIRTAALVAAPLLIVGFLLLMLLAAQRPLATRLLEILKQRFRLPLNIEAWAGRFLDGLEPLAHPRKLFIALLWTAAGWACTAGAGWALMYAFYEQGDLMVSSLFVGAVAFAVALPAVPGNLGTFELAIVTVLTLTGYGEPVARAVAFAVMLHAIDLGVYLVVALFGLFRLGISFRQLSRL